MNDFNKILDKLSGEDSERLLKVARFAELGMSASAVIHEIRQPLTALSMLLQMTLDGVRGDAKDTEKGLNEAVALITKTEVLLERARDFMSPSSDTNDIDLIDCVTKVLSIFQWQLGPSPRVELRAKVPDKMPILKADRAQIEQVLANLVANGLDAVAGKKNGVVLLVAKTLPDGVEFIVADNGMGMTDSVKARAFEPFFSTKGESHGTGLGLFIVSQIISRYHGHYRLLERDELSRLDSIRLSTGISLWLPIAKEEWR